MEDGLACCESLRGEVTDVSAAIQSIELLVMNQDCRMQLVILSETCRKWNAEQIPFRSADVLLTLWFDLSDSLSLLLSLPHGGAFGMPGHLYGDMLCFGQGYCPSARPSSTLELVGGLSFCQQ